MDEATIERQSIESMMAFIDNELGGWPILKGNGWDASKINIEHLLLTLSKYSLNPFFMTMSVVDPANSSVHHIMVSSNGLSTNRKLFWILSDRSR
jgi:hypothetical protein